MKKSKHTEEQIAFALKQAELGTSVDEVCRKMGISDATFYIYMDRSRLRSFRCWFTSQTAYIHPASWRKPIAQMGNPHEHSSTTGRPSRPL